MVKVTLSKMLSTIQNKQPLPNSKRLPRSGHLHHEHRILYDRFQVR